MVVSVKLVGALRRTSKAEEFTVEYQRGFTVKVLMQQISTRIPELRQNLIHRRSSEPQSNTLVLVNNVEASALNGLETVLQDGDEVVLIPVVHGG